MKPRVLCVSDVPGWAFDQNMRDMAEYLSDRFIFDHFYTANWFSGERPKWNNYDVIYEVFHRNPPMGIPYRRAIGALRGGWFKPEKPAPPDAEDIALVNRYRAFQVAVRKHYDELIEKCPNVMYLTNPINMRRFPTPTPLRERIVASWNGNAKHESLDGRLIKHFHDIVIPACRTAGVELVAAEYNTYAGPMKRRALAEMPAFYQQSNVALCASEYEAACGVGDTPVVMANGSTERLDMISAGDQVVTRDGSAQSVVRQWCEGTPDELIEIVTWGGKRLRFTKNHHWPVWAWLRKCMCGCGGDVTQGRLWVANHSGKGRSIRPIHVHGDTRNRSTSYRAIPPGYEPRQKMRSDELRVGDFLMIPRSFSPIKTDTSEDEARLLGYYTAEGNPREGRLGNYAVQFTFSIHEKDTWVADVQRILLDLGVPSTGKHVIEKNSYQIITTNGAGPFWRRPEFAAGRKTATERVKWLKDNAGELAVAKRFSAEVMQWPMNLKRELIIGLFRGDGHQSWKRPNKNGKGCYSYSVCYGTASLTLATQVQLILAQMGYAASIVTVPAHESDLRHLGAKNVSWSNDFYHITVASPWAAELSRIVWGTASTANDRPETSRKPRRPECMVDDDFVYFPIKSISVIKNDQPVYNLTVSGDHSYLVDNIATFNSNSVMEAMASGLAIIATDVGNHREIKDSQFITHGDSGILIVERTREAFVDALKSLTPERAQAMGEINRKEIQARWSWDVWTPVYERFLRKALDPVPHMSILEEAAYAAATAPEVDFSYWNAVDPSRFLADDWDNDSRTWVGSVVENAMKRGCQTLVEVGPGPGIDYARQFSSAVKGGRLKYTGFEGSSTLCRNLQLKYPEATWCNRPLTELPRQEFDIVYEKAVLEHQPALEPSLSCLLAAAKKMVVLIWYRPPGAAACDFVDGVYYQTFARTDVLDAIKYAGWKIVKEESFNSGNVGWILERDNASA